MSSSFDELIETALKSARGITKAEAKLSDEQMALLTKNIKELTETQTAITKISGDTTAAINARVSARVVAAGQLDALSRTVTAITKTSGTGATKLDELAGILKTNDSLINNTIKNVDETQAVKAAKINNGKWTTAQKRIAQTGTGLGIGTVGVMFANYLLVDGAQFSIISIQDTTKPSDVDVDSTSGYLLVTYNNESTNKEKSISLGPADLIDIKNTDIIVDTTQMNIYNPISNASSVSTFVIDKGNVVPKTAGIYTCGLSGTESGSISCGSSATITSYTTFLGQINNLPNAIMNTGGAIGDTTGDILSQAGSVLSQAVTVIIYILCAIFMVYFFWNLFWILYKSKKNYQISPEQISSSSNFGKIKTRKIGCKYKI